VCRFDDGSAIDDLKPRGLSWEAITVVGLAQAYLHMEKSRRVVQRRGNTDVVEHNFGSIRGQVREFDALQPRDVGYRRLLQGIGCSR
jgi:hypothetical protein